MIRTIFNDKYIKILSLIFSIGLYHGSVINASADFPIRHTGSVDSEAIETTLDIINTNDSSEKTISSIPEKYIEVNYQSVDLGTIINTVASQLGINIILPQGTAALKEKVSMKLPKPISLEEMWNKIIPMLIDAADLSLVPKNNMYVITRNNNLINREPFALYVNNEIEELPNNEQRIRYIYYLANMKVGEGVENNTLMGTLKALLPPDASAVADPITNAIMITARSCDIRSVINILGELDQVMFQEKMEIINLHHASATMVANIFNENILKPLDTNKYHLDARKSQTNEHYFSPYVKIAPLKSQNALLVLGRAQAVERIKEFIYKSIDVELESGNSMLHVYKLQYLNAREFADVLKRIIDSSKSSTGQSKGDTSSTASPERFFDEVIIRADTPIGGSESKQYYGGNKLIIACKHDDWVQIKRLIETFDTPKRTVLIEMLIADLTITDDRLLGATTRNPDKIPLPSFINYQTAPISSIITNQPDPSTIKADLLGTNTLPNNQTLANKAQPGTALMSLSDNDGKVWSLINVAKSFGTARIFSHPHIIAVNNSEAIISSGDERLLAGPGASTEGGAAVQKYEKIDAALVVKITPRISSSESVNLNIDIMISEFTDASTVNPPRTIRNFVTNANVDSGGIIVLGGLRIDNNEDAVSGDPFLSKIPILGYFFKNRNKKLNETSLTIFITPTIIEPRLRSGIGEYSTDYVGVVRDFAKEGELFDSLKDPITHWFFSPDNDPIKEVASFLGRDEFKKSATDITGEKIEFAGKKTKKKKRKKNTETTTTNDSVKADEQAGPNETQIKPQNTKEEYAEKIKSRYKHQDNPLKQITT